MECAATSTPLTPSAGAADSETTSSSSPFSAVSSASPQLAVAFGLASVDRDAGSRACRNFSMDSPQMPTLLVILTRANIWALLSTLILKKFVQEEEEENVPFDAFGLQSPAVELFLSPAGVISSSTRSSEFDSCGNDMDSSQGADSPRSEMVVSQSSNSGMKGRGKKKKSQRKRSVGAVGAGAIDLDAGISFPLMPPPLSADSSTPQPPSPPPP